ncbi:MAG: BON domain-containing protein [Acidimicrobiales bacterium]
MARLLGKGLGAVVVGSVGAAAAYFLDPDRGRARRARTRDQAAARLRRGRDRAGSRARYAQGRLVGAAARAGGAGELTPEDDIDVVHGIRQAWSGLGFPTEAVTVDVVDGAATLRGELQGPQQIEVVEDTTSRVPGVTRVESYLHLRGAPAPNKAASIKAASIARS